jgi:hypothetical protein
MTKADATSRRSLADDFDLLQTLHPPFAYAGGLHWIASNVDFAPGNSTAMCDQSRLVLLEDGRPLGPASSWLARIAGSGAGRNCHWQTSMHFSTSLGDDPNDNGRSYQVARLRDRVVSRDRAELFAETLVAVYDLACEMLTFDFLWVMAEADRQRHRLGLPRGHVLIVPGYADGLRDEIPAYHQAFPPTERKRRIDTLLRPLTTLFPAWTGFTLALDRSQALELAGRARHLHPRNYHPYAPQMLYVDARQRVLAEADPAPAFEVPAATVEKAETWARSLAGGRRIATLTLRDSPYQPHRNSRHAVWKACAERLLRTGWVVLTIPAEDATEPLPGDWPGTVVYAAAVNVALRAALYQVADINLGVDCGPMSLCRLNPRCRYLLFGAMPHDDGPARQMVGCTADDEAAAMEHLTRYIGGLPA